MTSMPAPVDATLLTALERIVGAAHVVVDPAVRAAYETDVSGRYRGEAALVVRPGDTGEVAAVVAACARAGAAIVPQGGNTGLAGGGVPLGGEVVLALTRLDAIGSPSADTAQIVVGAGATLAALQAALAPTPFEFAVDHAARSSATLGGMAATNAGGAQVFRFGSMRAQVAGFEAVLADGSVVRRMSGLLKDNSGYDLAGLLVGSEGTLAIITELALRLIPRRRQRLTGLLALRDVEEAVALASRLRGAVPSLVACELLLADGIALVCAHRRLPPPFALPDDAVCVLVECADDEDPSAQLAAALAHAPPRLAEAFADDSAGRARLWTYREAQNESVGFVGVPHKFDVTIAQGRIAAFLADVRAEIARAFPAAHLYAFGHLCDGNLHLNVVGVPLDDDARLEPLVLGLVASCGGSISAEHGVGQTRRDYLSLTRSDVDLAAMRAIKRALDPHDLLNPGKLLPAE